jgi:DNA-binding PadR family transcriptional regulator
VAPSPQSFLPLTHLMYAVLVALAAQPDHPYELVRRIRDGSDGLIDPGTGSFYSVLAHAETQGLIREAAHAPESRRRVYQITPLGRRVLTAEVDRLAAQVRTAQRVLLVDRKRP